MLVPSDFVCRSFGITMWEAVMLGAHPYPGISNGELFELLTKEKYRMPKPEACSAALYEVCSRFQPFHP